MTRSPSATPLMRQAERATRVTGATTGLLRGFDHRRDAAAAAGKLLVLLLPLGRTVRGRHLDGGHLVFRTIRRPVGIVGRDDIGLRAGAMEGRIDHATRDRLSDLV